jgi:hypothetical protein
METAKFLDEVNNIKDGLESVVQALNKWIAGNTPPPKLYNIPENIVLSFGPLGTPNGIVANQQTLWFNHDTNQFGIIAYITETKLLNPKDLAAIECKASDLKPGDVFTFNPNTIYTQEYYLCVMLQSCNLLYVNWKSGTNCGLYVPEIGSVGKGVPVYKVVKRSDYE